MKRLIAVIGIVVLISGSLQTYATCLVLGWMAKSVARSSSASGCVDSATVDSAGSTTTCDFPEQKIEVYPIDSKSNSRLVKCVCPRGGK